MDLPNQKNETTSSLTEILNSIKLDDTTKLNIVNYDFDNINNTNEQNHNNNDNYNDNDNDNINTKIPESFDKKTKEINIESSQFNQNNNFSQQVQLLSNDIDRRIGNYLLNELEKKQSYIDELEEAVKFQEKEIHKLKQKIESISKLELLSKIKSNMDSKLSDIESNLSSSNMESQSQSQSQSQTQSQSQSQTNKVVQVKKPVQITQVQKVARDEEQSQYPRNNPDLVLRKDTYQKVKSIPKEEEEPRYNGIMMLDKPKKEEEKIKISLDYETETPSSTEKMSEIIKQKRRNARF